MSRPTDHPGVFAPPPLAAFAAIALVTTGVFAYVRNPIYAGLVLIVFGICFASASDWTLVMTVALALALHFGVVLREERYLETTFGDAYLAYKRRVPRYGWPG